MQTGYEGVDGKNFLENYPAKIVHFYLIDIVECGVGFHLNLNFYLIYLRVKEVLVYSVWSNVDVITPNVELNQFA